MTRDQFLQRFPKANESTLRANGFGPGNQNSRTPPKLERDPGNEPLATRQVQKATTARFSVRVTSVRARLLDEDNLCEKYHVDCLRYAGLIPRDSPETTHIEVRQRKKEKGEEEHTVIEVRRL